MRDLLPELGEWLDAGQEVALACVITTWGSAPRRVGSYMAVNTEGQMIGSVSGGCVEGAVMERAKAVIRSGKAEYLHFGVANETAWDVGLACGGEIDIFVQPVEAESIRMLIDYLMKERAISHHFVVAGTDALLGANLLTDKDGIIFLDKRLEGNEDALLAAVKANGNSVGRSKIAGEDLEIFSNPLLPSPTLVIVGGVQIAMALSKIARMLHFRPIIVDPRSAFLNTQRFGEEQEIIQAWPRQAFENIVLNASTALASLTHDPKIDDPALIGALNSEAFYIGALGSKKTQQRRLKRLREKGVSDEALARIQGPIGLDIGADTPEEIALAIAAQIVEAYRA